MSHQSTAPNPVDVPALTPFRFWSTFLVLLVCWLVPESVYAQQRPLVTEDPETVGAGRVLLEGGFDYSWNATYPASGLSGNLLRLPVFGVSVGVSSIAEIQIDGGLYNKLSIEERAAGPLAGLVTTTSDTTSSVEDLVIGTKVRIAAETSSRPSIGFRFATKLPNASNESGIGLDTTDFHAAVLMAKTVESVRLVGNIGLGILGDPVRGDRQNDVLTYGASFARAVTEAAEFVGEINGRVSTRNGVPPPGTETRSIVRFGARYTTGPLRGDAGLLVGLTGRDPDFGITAGFTYVFDAFTIP